MEVHGNVVNSCMHFRVIVMCGNSPSRKVHAKIHAEIHAAFPERRRTNRAMNCVIPNPGAILRSAPPTTIEVHPAHNDIRSCCPPNVVDIRPPIPPHGNLDWQGLSLWVGGACHFGLAGAGTLGGRGLPACKVVSS